MSLFSVRYAQAQVVVGPKSFCHLRYNTNDSTV